MYKYYRCMSPSEYHYLETKEEVVSSVTHWAFSKADAEVYMAEGKVIACITLTTPLPAYYNSVALYLDGSNHLEVKATKEEFDRHLALNLEEVELV